MTTQPAPPRLLTVPEYLELGETEPGYSELVEGRFVMSPSPAPRHSLARSRLWQLLDRCAPDDLVVLQDVDVDLQLAAADGPGFVRRPDLVVARAEAVDRCGQAGGVLRASDVVLAVEVVSPGSRRTDHVIKRGEYADAGIPHYWIIDLTAPVSLLACHLAGEFGYADGGALSGTVTVGSPFDIELDLAQV